MTDYGNSETSADKPGATGPSKLSSDEQNEILRLARKRYDRAIDYERQNIRLAYDDLDFMAGKQWPEEVYNERNSEGRPCLTVNQMPQFVHQVTGDIRQMRPAIKVVGVDDQADPKLADLREGLIRYIENRSDAPGIYFKAADSQVACGIGHARVCTEYADDTTFEQELRIDGIDDQVSVLWDPDAKRQTKEDALFCFVPIDMTIDAFNEKFPDASLDELDEVKTWDNYGDWRTADSVRVSEYWVKKPKKIILGLTPSGETIDCTNDDEDSPVPSAKDRAELILRNGGRIEKRDSYEVCRYLITAGSVLEGPQEWAGRFIPIVPFIGEEVKIGRRLVRRGIIREAKDPQRQYNYFTSAQTECVALQPKAPFLVTEVNVAKYTGQWETANTKNWPYMLWQPDPKNGNQLPSRVPPPVSSQGITEGIALANDDMRRVIGIYDASLGARSNETSGVAIKQREQQGDTGTTVYRDNFARAIRQIGKILIDMIPHVYDTQRTIRIMGEDGKIDIMEINQEHDQAGQPMLGPNGRPVMLNDITAGAYDVIAEAGTSYATRREEASESMIAFAQAVPNSALLIADLIAQAQEWPLKDKIADRLHALLPPPVLQAEKAKEAEESGQPLPPDPQQQAQAMQEQAQQAALKAELDKKTAEAREANAKADQAEADAQKKQMEALEIRLRLQTAGVSMAMDVDAHVDDSRRAQERHEFDMARDLTNQMQGAEKHDLTIQGMTAQQQEQPQA